MNIKLFKIIKIKKQILIGLLYVIILLGTGFWNQFYCNKNKNFLKFHGQSKYSPLTSNGLGFYGKVNSFLEKALLDTNNVKCEISNLDSFYKRLNFYYPTDTSDYLVSVEDIRLVGYKPKDKDDSAFYFNSEFKNFIEKQNKNLTNKYFKIKWNSAKTKIESVSIDTTIINFSLQNDNWKGIIKFKDPFLEKDTNLKYLITENNIIPIFKSNKNTNSFKGKETKQGVWFIIDPQIYKKYTLFEYEDMYNSVNKSPENKSDIYSLNFKSNDKNKKDIEFSLRLLNSGDKIFFQTNNIYIISLNGKGINVKSVEDTTFAIPNTFNTLNLKFCLRDGNKIPISYKILNSSPFIASKPQNEGITEQRVHIDTSFLDLFSLQQVRNLESNISSKDPIKEVTLSTNFILSKYLEKEIKVYVNELYNDSNYKKRSDDIFEMSVLLMDISTGEVVAAPFYSNVFEKNNIDEYAEQRNFNLIKHDIASTFKPLISFAACLKFKSLADFILLPEFTKINNNKYKILGYPTLKYGLDRKGNPNPLFWSDDKIINRIDFLSKSHDNYPIALTMLALTEKSDPAYNILTQGEFNNKTINDLYSLNDKNNTNRIHIIGNRIKFNEIANSSFITLLSNLYDVQTTIKEDNILTFDTIPWSKLNTIKNNFDALYPDIVSLGTEKFGNSNADSVDFKKFEGFVLGQADNQWSNLKLAEAYSRLLSKRKVVASFIKNNGDTFPNLFNNPTSLFGKVYDISVNEKDINVSWVKFMSDWREAVNNQSNKLLNTALTKFNEGVKNNEEVKNKNMYYFYCKTGTPQDNAGLTNTKVFKKNKDNIWRDEGVFVFGVTNKNIKIPKGIVGVVYIKHLSLNKINGGVQSSTARDFLNSEIYKKIMFYNQNRF